MRISAFIVFMIGVIAILIHMFNLKAANNASPVDVTEPTADTLATETTVPPKNNYPVVRLVNNDYYETSIEANESEEEKTDAELEPSTYIYLSDEEIRDFSALVYLESGGESYECMKAVASVVINRMENSNSSLYDIIYAPNQFEPAHNIPYTTPSEDAINAVNDIVTNGPCIPKNVTFFRAGYYHNWSDLIQPYTVIDNTYFSYDVRIEVD